MVKTMQDETNLTELDLVVLQDEVIRLHDIARTLERAFGQRGQLSDDIRACADKLSQLLQRY